MVFGLPGQIEANENKKRAGEIRNCLVNSEEQHQQKLVQVAKCFLNDNEN